MTRGRGGWGRSVDLPCCSGDVPSPRSEYGGLGGEDTAATADTPVAEAANKAGILLVHKGLKKRVGSAAVIASAGASDFLASGF
jgi:hypothetical protein